MDSISDAGVAQMMNPPMKEISLLVLIGIFIGWSAAVLGADKLSEVFLRDAIQDNLTAIDMAQLVQDKTQNEEVKSLSAIILVDDWISNEQARRVAAQIGLPAPTESSISQKFKYDQMSRLSGEALDRAFVSEMIALHKAIIERFKNESKKTDDPVATFASAIIPVLKEHLDVALKLQSKI